MLECVEIETSKNPQASVIWLHGLGADGNDFVPIVKELGLGTSPAVRFVFPHAPIQAVTINNGAKMRAWYDVSFDGLAKRPDAAGIRSSQLAVEELISREKQRGVDVSSIVLAGFSQGGAIALQTGLRHPERLAGLMVLSSYLPLADSVAQEASAANLDVPVFMAHGTHDPMIPMSLAAQSHGRLLQMGYRVEWHEYPMEHSVCMEEIADIAKWLRGVLPG
jgi:phospholipase/carboxylesterase